MPHEIEATATTYAAPEVIFKHLFVADSWNEWASFWARARHEVVAYDPPRHCGYVAIAGMPRGYRVDITLEPHGVNTLIRWRGSFDGRIPGTAQLKGAMLRRRFGSFARRVAWHAERCEPGCPARLPVEF
ncbi:SRPBCC family protein [Spirillospora sp. NPDC046719]